MVFHNPRGSTPNDRVERSWWPLAPVRLGQFEEETRPSCSWRSWCKSNWRHWAMRVQGPGFLQGAAGVNHCLSKFGDGKAMVGHVLACHATLCACRPMERKLYDLCLWFIWCLSSSSPGTLQISCLRDMFFLHSRTKWLPTCLAWLSN